MPDRQEVLSSLYGALRLACFDENGMGFFNLTVEGFWRSFFAAVLLSPLYILSIAPDFVTSEGGFSFWAAMVHLVIYAAGWIIFPLVSFFVTDMLNLGHRFTALVVAVNWTSVLAFAGLTMAVALVIPLQQALASLLLTIVTAGVIVYHWFVIKTALDTTTGIAIAFVLFNFLLGAMLNQLAARLL